MERHIGAQAVVQRARREPAVGKLHRSCVDHSDVADPRALARLCAVAGADVDVQIADLGDLLSILIALQVDRLAADDAGHGSVVRVEQHALADQYLRIPTADFAKPQISLIVDVGHDQADLVDVTDHEQARRRGLKAVLC
jgi:hypothetical protein